MYDIDLSYVLYLLQLHDGCPIWNTNTYPSRASRFWMGSCCSVFWKFYKYCFPVFVSFFRAMILFGFVELMIFECVIGIIFIFMLRVNRFTFIIQYDQLLSHVIVLHVYLHIFVSSYLVF